MRTSHINYFENNACDQRITKQTLNMFMYLTEVIAINHGSTGHGSEEHGTTGGMTFYRATVIMIIII